MPEPVRTFSCRIYGVLHRAGKVLLTRSAFRGTTFVNFPGGGIEIGEAPVDALKREFREETGLEIHPVRALYSSEGAHLSTQSPIQIVASYWLIERAGGRLRKGGNGDDVLDLFWCDPMRLPLEEMFPSDKEFSLKLTGLLLAALLSFFAPTPASAGPIGSGDAHAAAATGFPGAFLGSVGLAVNGDENYAVNFLDALALHVKAAAVMTSKAELSAYLDQTTMGVEGPRELKKKLGRERLAPTKAAALVLSDALIRPEQFREVVAGLEALKSGLGRQAVQCFAAPRKVSDKALAKTFQAVLREKAEGKRAAFLPDGRFALLFDAASTDGAEGVVLVDSPAPSAAARRERVPELR
jgi:8-oxo-dGTP pyrophosphatase MutT (NUDIX family)